MQALYDSIGVGYDGTRRADPSLAARIRELLAVRPGARCLDLGCGTGNYTIALASTGLCMTGVDLSQVMLAEARGKSAAVSWHQADATALPFADGAFAGAVCTNALHHFPALAPVFREVHRVVRGGRLVLFTATPGLMLGHWLNAYFPRTMHRTMAAMPTFDDITDALRAAGFSTVTSEPFFVSPELQDLFLYSGKHRPTLYFDPAVRAGISCFVQYGAVEEVSRGCAALLDDLNAGRFAEVAAEYASGRGDYLFVVAETDGP